jgi:hypothetical protein
MPDVRAAALVESVLMTSSPDPILIRPATERDAAAIARLAELDSSPAPDGALLVAEVGGELRAALRVDDHAVIADPFHRTAGVVGLLAARAESLGGRPRGVRARLAHWEQLWHRATVLRPSV